MSNQELIFFSGEGDAWHQRNQDARRPYPNPIVMAIEDAKLEPKCTLEIGCGDGNNIAAIKQRFGGHCFGTDPSSEAIVAAANKYPGVHFHNGSASKCPSGTNAYDLIVYGFCLYLVDREDLFRVVYNADKALKDGGHIIIHDFDPDYPHAKVYHHKDGVLSYKMNYSRLWLANPAYSLVLKSYVREGESVTVIKKDLVKSWSVI